MAPKTSRFPFMALAVALAAALPANLQGQRTAPVHFLAMGELGSGGPMVGGQIEIAASLPVRVAGELMVNGDFALASASLLAGLPRQLPGRIAPYGGAGLGYVAIGEGLGRVGFLRFGLELPLTPTFLAVRLEARRYFRFPGRGYGFQALFRVP